MFHKIKTTNGTASITLHANPEYATWTAKLLALRERRAKLSEEREAIYKRRALREQSAPRTSSVDQGMTESVAELLGVTNFAHDPEDGELSARLQKIAVELKDTNAAIDIAERRLIDARNKASQEICEKLKPAYTARVAALATALLAAHKANLELVAMTDELEAADLAWTYHLPPLMASRMVGSPHDKNSALAQWLQEAVDAGFVKKSEIPEALK